MASPEGVAAAIRAARHVIEVENPFDLERHMSVSLDKRKIAPRIGNLGEVDELAGLEGHDGDALRVKD